MQAQIHGTTMPVLSVHFDPGESVVAEVGEFSWMTDSIQISTGMGTGMGGRSLVSALDRVAGGRTAPMSTYTAQGGPGTITFAPKVPGSILPVDVCPGAEYLLHQHGFSRRYSRHRGLDRFPAVVPRGNLRRRGLRGGPSRWPDRPQRGRRGPDAGLAVQELWFIDQLTHTNHDPVEPNPPAPRRVSLSDSTSTTSTVNREAMTSCAIFMPAVTVNVVLP